MAHDRIHAAAKVHAPATNRMHDNEMPAFLRKQADERTNSRSLNQSPGYPGAALL